jgi:hypothetical protein
MLQVTISRCTQLIGLSSENICSVNAFVVVVHMISLLSDLMIDDDFQMHNSMIIVIFHEKIQEE